MPAVDLIIGAPVWDRSFCLDIWFQSVFANVDTKKTGVMFVVPVNDRASRDIIDNYGGEFVFCHVIADKNVPYDRYHRQKDKFSTLAQARNRLLFEASRIDPEFYLSWDSDLFIEPDLLPFLMSLDKDVLTVWTWLNRQNPKPGEFYNDQTQKLDKVWGQDPPGCTAMTWESPGIANHFMPEEWDSRAKGLWPCDVALAFQLMKNPVFKQVQYAPDIYGEDLPFNWACHLKGFERWCFGEEPGVHLYDKAQSLEEVKLGYPAIMELAKSKPLAATHVGERSEMFERFGYFKAA